MRHRNEHIEVKNWHIRLKLEGEFWNRDKDLRGARNKFIRLVV